MFLQVGSSVAEIIEEGVELFGLRVDSPGLLVELFKPEGVGKLNPRRTVILVVTSSI